MPMGPSFKLSKKDVSEFATLYQEEFGIVLSQKEARQYAREYLKIMWQVFSASKSPLQKKSRFDK